MIESIKHEGKKYLRQIEDAVTGQRIMVDVYEVIRAFDVTCPGRQHALKKLLAAGTRGKGSELADLVGAQTALSRAIDFARRREETADAKEKASEPQPGGLEEDVRG